MILYRCIVIAVLMYRCIAGIRSKAFVLVSASSSLKFKSYLESQDLGLYWLEKLFSAQLKRGHSLYPPGIFVGDSNGCPVKAKCFCYFGPGGWAFNPFTDGWSYLIWVGACFCNPPFSAFLNSMGLTVANLIESSSLRFNSMHKLVDHLIRRIAELHIE